MKNILRQSKGYRKEADKLLRQCKLQSILKKYGDVVPVGSYAADLMMSGDIDLYVVNNSFSKKRVLEIFNILANFCSFRGYLFFDWKKNRHSDFPSAYYIGLKTKIKDTKWKIDIWFLNKKDLLKIKYFNLGSIEISKKQKEAILKFKWFCKKSPKYISSIAVYEAVLEKNIFNLIDFKKYLKNLRLSKDKNLSQHFLPGP